MAAEDNSASGDGGPPPPPSSTTNNPTSQSNDTAAPTPAADRPAASLSSSAAAASNTATINATSSSFLNAAAAAESQQLPAAAASSAAAAVTAAEDTSTNSSVTAVSNKLDQVKGYIQQTQDAMNQLEQQADMGKIGQYNTLSKVLKELKSSEVKLTVHLHNLQSGSPASALPTTQSIGQVPARTVEAVNDGGVTPTPPRPDSTDSTSSSAPPTRSMSERLTAGMAEADEITARLRNNVVRREDLVERYRVTRERLAALKRQRRDISNQERTLLVAQSPRETPYEDPIPGAESWNLEEVTTGLVDFRALYAKVATLRTAYTAKEQALEEGDESGKAEVAAKLEQLESKRGQLVAVIAQLKRHRVHRMREQGLEPDIDTDDFDADLPSAAAMGNTAAGASGSSLQSTVEGAGPSAAARTGKGSVSIGTLPPILSTDHQALPAVSTSNPADNANNAISTANIVASQLTLAEAEAEYGPDDPRTAVIAARVQMVAAGQELELRTTHLANLKEELASMKRLLDTTQQRVNNPAGASGSSAADADDDDGSEAGDGTTNPTEDLQRQNPVVVAKYKQLSETKKRMAAMQEVMTIISETRGTGRQLSDVLTTEQLALLQEAEAEEDPSGEITRQRLRAAPSYRSVTPAGTFTPNGDHRSPAAGRTAPTCYSEDSDDGGAKHVKPRNADPQQRSSNVHYRNDAAATTNDNNASYRQQSVPRNNNNINNYINNSVSSSSNAAPLNNNDPRVAAIATLQEEVRQKKNAMEALMRGVGKPSSLHPDNLSDDALDGDRPLRPQRRGRQSVDPQSSAAGVYGTSYNNRGSLPPQLLLDSGAAVNDSSSVPMTQQSVRPKHATHMSGIAAGGDVSNTHQQRTISDALQQLTSVQGSINSLYNTLRTTDHQHDDGQRVATPNAFNASHLQQQQQQLMLQNTLQQSPLLNNAVFAANAAGLCDPATAANMGVNASSNNGLQQCFSQLYLHSLEIQALNKHIQVRNMQQQMQLMLQQNMMLGNNGGVMMSPYAALAAMSGNMNAFGGNSFNQLTGSAVNSMSGGGFNPINGAMNPMGGAMNPLNASMNPLNAAMNHLAGAMNPMNNPLGGGGGFANPNLGGLFNQNNPGFPPNLPPF